MKISTLLVTTILASSSGLVVGADVRSVTQAELASMEQSPRLRRYVDKPGVPPGAQIVVEVDKVEHFLGENVLIQFGLRNDSAEPIKFEMGGDYRGVPRATRFRITARATDGTEMSDPYPVSGSMGGLIGPTEVKPGETWWEGIPLMRYRSFDRPGEYTIRVQHDLGWGVPMEQMPAGEVRIRFVMPTAEQAEAVVAVVAAQRVEERRGFGQKLASFPDFSTLRFPVYLPALAARARAGNVAALDGIGAIPTPEATEVLVALMSGADAALATEAARRLSSRLPDPDFSRDGPSRSGPFLDLTMDGRRALAAAAWRPEYAAAVRAKARSYLTLDSAQIVLGAYMLECVGTPEDLAVVQAALESEITGSKGRVWKDEEFPSPPGNAAVLERALRQLVKRGGTVPARPRTPGGMAVLAIAVQQDATLRSAGWEEAFAAMLDSDIPYLRQLALARMPQPVPVRFRNAIAANAEATDLGLQHAALELIGKEKLEQLLPLVERVLRASRRQWVLNAADNAAFAMGSVNRHGIWVDRLTESGMAGEAMGRLWQLIEGASGSSWGGFVTAEVAAAQELWREFLSEHAEEIRAGTKFAAGESGGITEAMIPRTMKIWIDGKQWPERPD